MNNLTLINDQHHHQHHHQLTRGIDFGHCWNQICIFFNWVMGISEAALCWSRYSMSSLTDPYNLETLKFQHQPYNSLDFQSTLLWLFRNLSDKQAASPRTCGLDNNDQWPWTFIGNRRNWHHLPVTSDQIRLGRTFSTTFTITRT